MADRRGEPSRAPAFRAADAPRLATPVARRVRSRHRPVLCVLHSAEPSGALHPHTKCRRAIPDLTLAEAGSTMRPQPMPPGLCVRSPQRRRAGRTCWPGALYPRGPGRVALGSARRRDCIIVFFVLFRSPQRRRAGRTCWPGALYPRGPGRVALGSGPQATTSKSSSLSYGFRKRWGDPGRRLRGYWRR